MALPLPSVVPDVGPGGPIVTSMLGANALTKSNLENTQLQLKNQYYAPDIQSQIAYRQAQTQGQNITNQYLPEQLRLANALSGMNLKYFVPKTQAEINLQQAQAGLAGSEAQKNNYLVQHPGLMGGEDAKTIQSLMDMGIINKNSFGGGAPQDATPGAPMGAVPSSVPGNSPSVGVNMQGASAPSNALQSGGQSPPYAPFNTGNSLVDAMLNKPYANMAYQQKMTQGFNWVHSPVDAKDYQIAQLAGAGIDPSESVSLLTQGNTVPQILQSKGFDPNNPPSPDFLPTKGNITQLKKRQAALNEMNTIGDFVTSGLGLYPRTIGGYAPAQIADALSGSNDDKQSTFLAARALSPELSNLRLMVAQARTGKYAMQSMMDKSMTNINALRPLVSGDVWTATQKKVQDKLTEALGNAEKAYQVAKKNTSTVSQKPVSKMTTDELIKERDALLKGQSNG